MTRTVSIPQPAAVRWARLLLALVALSHLAVPLIMFVTRATLRGQIAAQHPELDAGALGRSVEVALAAAGAFHGVLLVLCLVLIRALPAGRPWSRWLTTVSQAASIAFAAVSWSSSPMFHLLIPVVAAAQVALVALLWLPGEARAFFGARNGS